MLAWQGWHSDTVSKQHYASMKPTSAFHAGGVVAVYPSNIAQQDSMLRVLTRRIQLHLIISIGHPPFQSTQLIIQPFPDHSLYAFSCSPKMHINRSDKNRRNYQRAFSDCLLRAKGGGLWGALLLQIHNNTFRFQTSLVVL